MRIVVIGATSAIAEHCCREWLKQGPADLLLVARDTAKARRIAADLARRPVVYTPGRWALIMLIVRHLPRFVFNRLDI